MPAPTVASNALLELYSRTTPSLEETQMLPEPSTVRSVAPFDAQAVCVAPEVVYGRTKFPAAE